MSKSERSEPEKGELWVKFITYIQVYGNKKNTEEKAKLLDFISTSVDNLDNFFYWLLERSDVYSASFFPEVMISILNRIIYYRNVPMFKRFVYEFAPIYLRYLVLSPDILANKQTKELLNILFLSYPLTRAFLQQTSEVFNEFLSSILHISTVQLQQGYLEFIQNVLYLYPDLPLNVDVIPETTRCPVFKEVDIGKRIQSYYITPWNAASLKESPPLGNYLSDSEGTLTVNSDYSQSTPSTSTWYSLSSPLDRTITKFIHSSSEGDVYTLRAKENRVLYWVCPECSTQNDQIQNCKSCNMPPPDIVKENSASPVYYIVPGVFMNNYYITQNDNAFFPVSYIRYSTPMSGTDLMQKPFTKTPDSVFFLPPQFYVSCYFPMDYNYFNSLYSSLIIPSTVKGLFTVVYSECLSLNFNADASKLILVLNPNKVVSYKSVSHTKNSVSNDMSVEIPVDKDLLCNIHYSVLNSTKIVIQIVNEVIICKLKEPINNLTSHLSQFIICNIPTGSEQSKVGILGIMIYRSISESKWTEIPPNAITLSLLGNHFSEDHGVRYLSEDHLYRCSLKIGMNSHVNEPICHFFEKTDIINNKRNTFIVNEFCYYNDICIMNSYVDCLTSDNSVNLGNGPRVGSMYWKYLFSPSSFDVSFTVDMKVRKDNYSIMWLTNETLPTHSYINMIMKAITSLSDDMFEEHNIPIPFSLTHSMVFVIIRRINPSTMKVHFGYTIKGSTIADNHIHIGIGLKYPIESHLSMGVALKDSSISLRWENDVMTYKCLDEFTQPNSHFLVGWSGNNTTLYDFSLNAGGTCSSLYIIPDKAIHLDSLHLLVKSSPVSEYPCTIRYRDKPAFGSTDITLSHPKIYEGEGYVYSIDSSFKHYVIFASDKNKKDFIYCMFNNENEQNTMFSIYSAFVATEKRISRASDCVVSCFGNNRIQRYGKNCSGIANSNNTCFQNSTLQLLFHSDLLRKSIFEFYDAFTNSKCDHSSLDAQCLRELVLLLTRLQVSIRGYEVNNLVEVLEKRFEIGYQHDMNEYFDYLLNAVDNCYNQLKKVVGDGLTMNNPLSLITGKQKEMVCCQCGKTQTPVEDKKETEFQNSYISLTSSIAPITSISFQLFAYDAIPSTPFTTYIFVFEYKSKGVFLVLERNPKKEPISNILMKDKSGLPSNSVRIPSFHSYVSSQLYYQPFSPCYNHSTEICEDNTIIPVTSNKLVVDVLIRIVTSSSGEISQTNNGVFELIGGFEYGDQEYEIYQKVVNCSSAEVMDMKGTIAWNKEYDLSKTLPMKCDSALSCLSSVLTPSNFSYKEKNGFILFSQQIELGVSSKENHVSIVDKDNIMKMALYANRSLVGLASLDSNVLPCRVGSCELIIGDTPKAKGYCYFSSSMLYVFDETYFDQFGFKIIADGPELISAIEYEGEWYSFAGCDDGAEYLFISEKSNTVTLVISEFYGIGQMRSLLYTHKSVNNTTPFEGTCITYSSNMYLCIPHSSSFAGCYYSFNQEDPYIPIEQRGTSFWYQKKKLVTNTALCYIYSGYSLSYRLYIPQVYEMSISSMIQFSMNIQDEESEKQCDVCNTPICTRHFITSFPDYLPISISRTFFDTSTYSLTKDCSHIFINPSISILKDMYDLYAIVVHVGYSFDSGHYVVYCRHSDDEKNTSGENELNTWNLFNDDTVYPCEWSEVLSQIYDYGTCPYYVVYRRRCTVPKAHPTLFVPSYLRSIPSLSQYNTDFVKLAEDNNDSLLREVPNAPFLLRSMHNQK